MNEELFTFYRQYLINLINNFSQKEKLGVSKPLILNIPKTYNNNVVKIMIVGKETHGGWGSLSEITESKIEIEIEKLQSRYRQFINDDAVNSPFWNFFKKIGNRFEMDWKRIIWNNISKIDFLNKTPPLFIQIKNIEGYKLVKKEIEMLNPSIVIFLGSDIEWLKFLYTDISIKEISPFLDQLFHVELPNNTYWTYHPNYLSRSGNIEQIDLIINDIYAKFYETK